MSNTNFYAQIQPGLLAANTKSFIEADTGTITFSESERLSAQLANLIVSTGLQPGDRLLTRTPKSAMALMLYLACLRSGIIYVPVNPACTSDELNYFLADATPRLFVGDERHAEQALEAGITHSFTLDENGQGSLVDAATAQPDTHSVANNAADDIAVMIYTSGTTGNPKGAMLSHGNLIANARTLYDTWGWSANDVLLHCLPIFHVHGLFVATHLALLGTSTMLLLPKFDADAVLDRLPRATVFMGVPTYYTRLLQEKGLSESKCANMRLFISGSAPLLETTFTEFQDRTGHTILERYGMSETGMLTSNPLDGDRVAGTVGFALPGVATRIRDKAGNEPEAGDAGVLQVKGANVFAGYWGKEDLNASEFQDGYFITGDLVTQDAQGRISIVGRNKDLVISGGLNIYPKEIEAVLDRQDGVIESAVFGVAHPDFGEGLIAVVVKEPDAALEIAALYDACRQALASYKIPKHIALLPELPRNTMGKVQKNRLREAFSGQFQG